MRRRSRISLIATGGDGGVDRARFPTACRFLFELAAREQAKAERLLNGHCRLLGLDLIDDVDERPCGSCQGQSIPPDGGDLLVVGMGVDHDTRWAAEAAVTAGYK